MSTTSVILDFADIDATMLGTVGGKAANLGELTNAGLAVPAGFCVTTAAYRQVATGLVTDRPDLARQALLSADVPAPVADAVRAKYAELGRDVPVAVRSSATEEDLPFASFAGQQD